MGFLGGSAGKEYAQNSRDLGLIPVLGRSPGEGNRYPLQYSGLENSMNCIVHAVIKGRTPLSDFHFTSSYYHCYFFCSFPGGSDGRESVRNEGDLGLIPVLGRSPRGRHGNPLQYSRLENPMDRGAWQATVHGVAELDTTD